jgi:hypothetical protein
METNKEESLGQASRNNAEIDAQTDVQLQPDEVDFEAERRRQAIELGYDPDLYTTSCIGSGVMYPDLWHVVKRYILRGDEYYQSGGLSILASTAWHMPLGEATEVLEAYFEKHNYCPILSDGRGGINLTALSAAYAVATTSGWDASVDIEERRERMLILLERCRDVMTRELPSYLASDAGSVEETIEAIRSNKANFEPKWPEQLEYAEQTGSQVGLPAIDLVPSVALQATPTSAQTEALVHRLFTALKADLPQMSLSQMDLITVKHGYEMLSRDIAAMEKLFTEKIVSTEKRFEDRFGIQRDERQEQLERSQVRFGKWGVIIATVTLVVSTIVAVAVQLFLP